MFPLLRRPRPSFKPGGQCVGIGRSRTRGGSEATTVALDEPLAPLDEDVTGAFDDGFEVNDVLGSPISTSSSVAFALPLPLGRDGTAAMSASESDSSMSESLMGLYLPSIPAPRTLASFAGTNWTSLVKPTDILHSLPLSDVDEDGDDCFGWDWGELFCCCWDVEGLCEWSEGPLAGP